MYGNHKHPAKANNCEESKQLQLLKEKISPLKVYKYCGGEAIFMIYVGFICRLLLTHCGIKRITLSSWNQIEYNSFWSTCWNMPIECFPIFSHNIPLVLWGHVVISAGKTVLSLLNWSKCDYEYCLRTNDVNLSIIKTSANFSLIYVSIRERMLVEFPSP